MARTNEELAVVWNDEIAYRNASGQIVGLWVGSWLSVSGGDLISTGWGGDVTGPATNADNYIPLWNGTDSKALKNGIPQSTFEPAVAAGWANTVWHGDKTFSQVVEADISLSNNTTNNVSVSKHGFAPILSGNSLQFLDGSGNYSIPTAGVANSYTSVSFSSQTSVNVIHNFGAHPVVQVMDNTGAVMIPLTITHNTLNDFTVTFTGSTSGMIMASVGSPQPQALTVASGNYTVLTTDNLVKVTGANATITLPTAVGNTGRQFTIKNISVGNITLNTTSSQTIDNQLTQTLGPNEALTVVSDGSNYFYF